MNLTEEQYLAHYGILRKSGRYPWGSGEDQPTRNRMFIDTIEALKKEGMTDDEIRRGFSTDEFPISTTRWRAAKSIAKNQIKAAQISQAERLRAKQMSDTAAAEQMGLPGSTYRALLEPGARDRVDVLSSTADMLRGEVEAKKYVDVGAGVGETIGLSQTRFNTAVAMLEEEGYSVHPTKVPQAGTGKDTEMKVLCPPGTTFGDVQRNKNSIQQIHAISKDYGRNWSGTKVHDPISIDPKRLAIRYKEDGGDKTDGVIYVRPNVKDISLGAKTYAQVRVKVGDSHYLKGMAMYKDDLPEGTDLLFSTNKSKKELGDDKLAALKPLTDSKEYPFKTVVRQQLADEGKETEHVTSSMNLVFEEGDWKDWRRALSSQVLSKQSPTLAKTQLGVTFERRKQEFDEINALNNPTIKKKLLEEFAKQTDSSAVSLHAAALNSRQRWHVILPIESMKPTEVYAPNYDNGERVVLIRHPHAGTFEIPELTVNNKNREAMRTLGNIPDAIGIHHSVAQHLSGADFDGDSVIVIPNSGRSPKRIKTTPMLEGLKDFDPHTLYRKYEGMEVISPDQKQNEMGKVSNLITDMTIRKASPDEIARAVKHSMVIIDAEKHELNWKLSYEANGIAALKAKYQTGGASTLISLAKSPKWVPHRRARYQSEGGPIDPVTGKKEWTPTGFTTVNKKGQVVPKMIKSRQMAETDNAHSLSSGTLMESIYADHANALKGLANQARLVAHNTPLLERSPSSREVYAPEVKSLTSKVTLAKMNAPLERQAQLLTRASMRAKIDSDPTLADNKELQKKIRYQELAKARERVGQKHKIDITDKEWDAIQAGAISNSQLITILNNADIEKIKARATPRTERKMTSNVKSRAFDMLASGYTRAQVSQQLGVSLSTLDKALKEGR